jgi:hypothetical protein
VAGGRRARRLRLGHRRRRADAALPRPAADRDDAADRARFIREHLPAQGLFAEQEWRIAPEPFPLDAKLADELEKLGLKENTIILFASDNGSQFVGTHPDEDMQKATNSLNDVNAEIDSSYHMPNFPFRGTKWTAYEGGVRTPLIASWKDNFPSGTERDDLIALNDILPTLAAIVGQDIPKDMVNPEAIRHEGVEYTFMEADPDFLERQFAFFAIADHPLFPGRVPTRESPSAPLP